MRVRTFIAPNMKAAMAQVRAELGPDAIVLYFHERKRGRGVEVRAAAELPPLERAPAEPRRATTLARAAGGTSTAHAPERRTPKAATAPAPRVKTEPQPKPGQTRAALLLAFAYHGLPAPLAEALMAIAAGQEAPAPEQALAGALETRFRFAGLPVLPPRPVMLVGGPGVGKTVTTAKLAARALLAGHRVRVITTDTLRSGAVEQLTKLLGLMDLGVECADTPETLAAMLKPARARKDATALFIDTPGMNALSQTEQRDLARFIKAADIEPVLVQAAGADVQEAAADAALFARLGARRLITTRLDTARRYGSLLAAADGARLALAEVSLSPYLSEPLGVLSPVTFARVLLTQSKAASALARGKGAKHTEHPLQ